LHYLKGPLRSALPGLPLEAPSKLSLRKPVGGVEIFYGDDLGDTKRFHDGGARI